MGVRPMNTRKTVRHLRACLKTAWSPAGRDFGDGQGGEGASAGAPASSQWAVTAEPTKAAGKRPAARRVFKEKAGGLRCSSVRDRCGYPPSSRLAIQPFPRKQDSHGILKQALMSVPAVFLICFFFGCRTSALQGIASNPCGHDAA